MPRRRSVTLQPAASFSPRERAWAEIRKQRRYSYESIEDKTKVPENTVRNFTKALIAAGYVKEVVRGRSGNSPTKGIKNVRSEFQLVRDPGVVAPRIQDDGSPAVHGMAQLNIWRAMHIIGDFDVDQLVMAASTDELRIPLSTVKRYVGYLNKAKYLCLVKVGARGATARKARYRLGKYTGPHAPMVQAVKQLYDPNLGAVVWAPDARELADET